MAGVKSSQMVNTRSARSEYCEKLPATNCRFGHNERANPPGMPERTPNVLAS